MAVELPTLTQDVFHDLNNTLSIIQAHTETAAAGLAPDHPVRRELLAIEAAVDRAARRIADASRSTA